MKKSKKIVWTIVLIIIAVIAVFLYEMFRFKPHPPVTDEQGRILSTPDNGFRHYQNPPEVY